MKHLLVMLGGVTLASLLATTAAAQEDPARAAARDPAALAVAMKDLSARDMGALVSRVMQEAARLPLPEKEMKVRLVQLAAAAVQAAGNQVAPVAAALARATPSAYLNLVVAAAVVAAEDRADVAARALIEAAPIEDLAQAVRAANSPRDILGPILAGVANDAAAGIFRPPQALRTGALAAPSPLADKAPVTTVTTETSTTTTTSSSVPPPPVLPPYPGQ